MDRQIQSKTNSAKEYERNPLQNYCSLVVGSAETNEIALLKSSWIFRARPNSSDLNYCLEGEKLGCSFALDS